MPRREEESRFQCVDYGLLLVVRSRPATAQEDDARVAVYGLKEDRFPFMFPDRFPFERRAGRLIVF